MKSTLHVHFLQPIEEVYVDRRPNTDYSPSHFWAMLLFTTWMVLATSQEGGIIAH